MAHIDLDSIERCLLIDTIVGEIADAETEAEENCSEDFKREMQAYISTLITLRTKLEVAK
jgi:hypothetical protein